MDTPQTPNTSEQSPNPQASPSTEALSAIPDQSRNTSTQVKLIIIGIAIILFLIGGAVVLFVQEPSDTSHIRDIFIIFMALESLVIGAALIILSVQLAILINLIQNEIRPILDATNETVNTLKGTTVFLSNNLVEPVIKLNEYLASLKKIVDIFRLNKR